ncbi:hypothetical protein V8J88_02405 [Massilia sp. W12]|uniref:hypothetical protein n=1 Tax=Massilia sp. W12 TaxID=3126507 RepID=UPI0030CF4CD6
MPLIFAAIRFFDKLPGRKLPDSIVKKCAFASFLARLLFFFAAFPQHFGPHPLTGKWLGT